MPPSAAGNVTATDHLPPISAALVAYDFIIAHNTGYGDT